jgi:multiple sugar transport system substrate-binding protein
MIRFVFALLASTLVVTPIAAGAADLTIWWSKGYYPSEDEGLRRVVAGFEDETQTKVDLTFVSMPDLATKTLAALESGEPPDIDFLISEKMRRWAFEGALLNLDDVVGPITADLDPTVRELALMENGRAGGQGYYRIPIGLATVHIHVWQSLLDQAGIPPSAIPGEWDAFWDFWCDQVQPAVRRLPGHEKAYGVGLTLSTSSQSDALNQIVMFLLAHDAYFMSPDGRLLFDEPGMRGRIVKALESFTAPAKKGCVPPGAMNWTDTDNNANFLNQTVVMVANASLSIPASRRETNPENYYKNIATIPWPKASTAARSPSSGAASMRSPSLLAPTRRGPRPSCAICCSRSSSGRISRRLRGVSSRRCQGCSSARSGSPAVTRTSPRLRANLPGRRRGSCHLRTTGSTRRQRPNGFGRRRSRALSSTAGAPRRPSTRRSRAASRS